jgi:thiol-disulfide isomerase/thioredoxin/YHS domain-containing protein
MRDLLRTAIAILVLSGAAAAIAQDQMPWQPNLEAAQRLAAQSNRLVLIHFWAPWCRPCMRLEKEVFSNPQTAKALESNFVMVKLNADEAPGTTRLYGVSSLPSDVITTPAGRLVSQMQSPPTAQQYIAQLNQAAAGHRSLARKPEPQSAQVAPPGAAPNGQPPVNSGAAYGPNAAPYGAYGAAAAAPYQAPPAGANDRYAEYYPPQQSPAPPAGGPDNQVMPAQAYSAQPAAGQFAAGSQMVDPYAAPPAQPPAADPYAAAQPPANPYAAPQAAAGPYAASVPHTAGPPNAQASYQPRPNVPQLPPGCPPIGLDGNCPVTLIEQKRWTVGSTTFGAVHRGRTYLFLGPQEREKFLADPDRYSPVLSGIDPVMAIESRTTVPGKREFGVFGADGRIYLFADENSRARFEQNEQYYASQALQAAGLNPTYQAMRPSR